VSATVLNGLHAALSMNGAAFLTPKSVFLANFEIFTYLMEHNVADFRLSDRKLYCRWMFSLESKRGLQWLTIMAIF
jgi:hypothetical protein